MYKKYEELLKERNLTTAEVSRGTGISESVISNWKKRGGNLSLENAKKVADFLGVSIEELLK